VTGGVAGAAVGGAPGLVAGGGGAAGRCGAGVRGCGNGGSAGGCCWASAATTSSARNGMDQLYALRDFCRNARPWLVETIEALAALESPSDDKAAVDRCGAAIAERLAAIGGRVTRISRADRGDHLLAEFVPSAAPSAPPSQVLLLGHFDTVWPLGQVARMPIVQSNGRLHGPGVFDMKSGIAVGMLATRALLETGAPLSRRILMLWTSDEEIGSGTSRTVIEEQARRSDAVLVLEPSLPGGAVKTSRKGVGEFEIAVRGVAAHAGLDPRKGASAIHELARQILRLLELQDLDRGISVNVGTIAGGTRTNVAAEEARAALDVRALTSADASTVADRVRACASSDSRITVTVSGGFGRPPLERTAAVVRLYEQAKEVAAALGVTLGEGSAGGGSDGNFTGALGVPTLDGLGPDGDGAHALHEHVELDGLPDRAALVAGLIARL
jgi:glutamate carboxypeptidase